MTHYKILNLYAGIGGNRKLWGDDHEVTAVELDEKIAWIYQDHFPNDTMVVGDAHQYLLEHFKEFDFVWSSPPCPTHSRIRNEAGVGNGQYDPVYPDMKLYEEIIFMQHLSKMGIFEGKYCIENVIGYYEPLVAPQKIGEHYFWSNFPIPKFNMKSRGHFTGTKELEKLKGFNVRGKGLPRNGETALRDCTEPELGYHILKEALKPSTLL